ncbi:cyclin-SDS-like [Impatiens glandulifera]|uniref:cyclin-SDS-like n=1 Tax=Impatiens glandulifera TaxID=253017 RepID=UPI001FB17545|nr:cyclin-SDS-like [Impatiens glandulifera]
MKHEIQPIQLTGKRIPRKRRTKVSPIQCSDKKARLLMAPPVVVAVDSTASSHLTTEISCSSSGISVNKDVKINEDARENELLRKSKRSSKGEEIQVSESSCVESSSRVAEERNHKRIKLKGAVKSKEVKEFEYPNGDGSEIGNNCLESSEKLFKLKDIGVDSTICSSVGNIMPEEEVTDGETRVLTIENSDASEKHAESKFTDPNSESTVDQREILIFNHSDLVCLENLCCDEDISDYSSSYSSHRTGISQNSLDLDSSTFSPSIWMESGSKFSEKSFIDSGPSPTFSLFLEYSQQFSTSTSPCQSKFISPVSEEEYFIDPSLLMCLEEEEDRTCYQIFRNRERKYDLLPNFAEYCRSTGFEELIIDQRSQMIQWIVKHSTAKELQKETMFLAISLFDRFLSKGYFRSKRNIQIVGISCLTLATRIEENQPYNSFRQKTFRAGHSTFSRCEVVAMEWLVLEVLNFNCYLPTIYSFLWFYLKAAKANEEVEKNVMGLSVLALLGHERLSFWPSTVAAGLVILASMAANKDAFSQRVIETHVNTEGDDLTGCIKCLGSLINQKVT